MVSGYLKALVKTASRERYDLGEGNRKKKASPLGIGTQISIKSRYIAGRDAGTLRRPYSWEPGMLISKSEAKS